VKLTIEPVALSPLLKAKLFSQMIREDNARIQKFLNDGGNPNAARIEALDEADPARI
jgi:hypothetical protein